MFKAIVRKFLLPGKPLPLHGLWLVGLSLTLMSFAGRASADTLFNATFDACPSGALSASAATAASTLNLGTAVGTWSFAGTTGYGAIGTNSANGSDHAAGFDHNTTAQTGMAMMPENGVAAGSSYPVTVTEDAPGPNGVALFANFAGAGGFTGTNSTAINFNWGSYGNESQARFKYAFVRGLDANGNEVFELLWYQGSTSNICQILARGAGDTQTVLSAVTNQPVIQGTIIATNFDPALVNTNVASTKPPGMIPVSILLTNNQVTYTIFGGTPNTFPVNSGAASISQLEFSEVWNSTLVDGENSGFWLDDISAVANATVPVVSAVTYPARVNLAKYQPVTTDSDNGVQNGAYLTDGLVTDTSSWISDNSGPHWAQVTFPFPVTVGSAQMVMGLDNVAPPQIFQFQYLTNGTWLPISGTTVIGNANKDMNLVFPAPVTATAFRFYDSFDGTVDLRELALYPPNGTNGFPFGTDFSVDVARKQPAQASANTYGNWPLLANDGLISSSSAWETTLAGNNTLTINLQFTNKIGSAHLYSGATGIPPLSSFVLQYATGSGWANIPGGSVSGNNSSALVIPFTTPVTTKQVRLVFTNTTTSAVQELCVFPANNPNGYPLGTGVRAGLPSTAIYDTFSDSYYYLSNSAAAQVVVESNGAPALGSAALTNGLTQYQVLLNYDTGTYRLINRASGLCLAGAQLTTNAGVTVAEEPYSSLPDQDWYLQSAGGNNFNLVNQFSGLALDVQSGSLVQNVLNNAASQQWQISLAQIYPKKGLAGSGKVWNLTYNSHWTYGWWYYSSPNLPRVNYFPMDPDSWYRGSSVSGATNGAYGNLWGFLPGWRTAGYALNVMGFNEPDNVNQANLDPTNAAIYWLNDQNLDLPLAGPAMQNLSDSWLPIFFGYITNWGCRVDYLPGHEYVSPAGGSSSAWINPLQTAYNNWHIPMWLTEFSIVDWAGNQKWTEEDNYNALAEFVWRTETISWLRKYSLFVFTADANDPMAPNPWTITTPAPRSNAFDSSGNLTPFGELYAAWDDDANVETNKFYYIHNQGTRKRLQNALGATVNATDIRADNFSVQWTLQAAGGANLYYLASAVDGRRLSYNGGAVSLVAANTADATVQWKLTANQYGWYYLDHPASGLRLKLAYDNATSAATFSMVANTTTGSALLWRFVSPLPPMEWTGSSGAAWNTAGNWGSQQVPLTGVPVAFSSLSTGNLNTTLGQNFKVCSLGVTTPAGPVSIGGVNTLTLGSGGFDLAAASQNLTVSAPLVLSANQTWTIAPGRTLTVSGGTGENGTGVSLTLAGGGTVVLGWAASFTGDGTINPGLTLRMGVNNGLPAGSGYGNLSANGTLDLNGNEETVNGLLGSGVVDNTSANAATLTVGQNDVSATFTGLIQNSGAALNLVKTGAGTFTLTAASSYTGNTLINAGKLILSGNANLAGSASILIAGGATLDVSAKSSTFALNGHTLGNTSVGAVLNGNCDVSASGLSLVADGVNPALIQTNGTLTLSANTTVQVNNTGAPLGAGTYTIIAAATAGNAGLVSGTLPPVTVTGNGAAGVAALQINASGGLDLVVTVASNPTSISYNFNGGDFSLTWPADHIGWIAQSNVVDVAISSEWHDIPNSQSATNLVIPINLQNANVFYRLRSPN